MTQNIGYHIGGFDPGAPRLNVAECWDDEAGTYTRWDVDGVEIEARPLTDQEAALLARQGEIANGLTNGDTIRARLEAALVVDQDYRAKASPTAAQNAAQLKALTLQVMGLIRLQLDLLDETD